MRFGIHLPQYGRAAGGEAITRVARHAEALGFHDVWVSDHVAIPDGAPYPPSFLFEPIVALTWAAAATTRVGLGTSVLVLPYRHPLELAKELASLDQLSGGRLTIGIGSGWLQAEFDALDVPYAERGARTDEAIDCMRACWGEQPVTFAGPTVSFEDLKVVPGPAHPIEIWVGGGAPPALRRAVAKGDGWHGTFSEPERTVPVLARLRAERPEETFTLSVRTNWDGIATDAGDIERDLDALAGAGLQHVLVTPAQGDIDGWLRSADALWERLAPRAD
ncbi:MAG: TIGR03619 family F420-dependent LLM class oxidoreductase [Actinobacteria bacterium]|nr:TIGR03619 family F420-dependent LLM class oxidoreductase [Actinomycetota bacterium]MBV8958488.1 TIGR03619 family F420-dependent LLM class oxidoreductase [Actinomycetota bacterium]MBV9253474.1 TIGR03619 family F420-dependent LLM class oxidoreductase [Actinomycetota bacterium]MBV9664604.1 TIGR03619 family F420-dependent LLM class oxidoreductase [Actinomycetota bacterium]